MWPFFLEKFYALTRGVKTGKKEAMCGIVGVFERHGRKPINQAAVRQMRDALSYRGPDDKGEYFDIHVGLGHRRLSIIDLQEGRQPFSTPDGRYTIVFNGEIYNYRDLREKLNGRYTFTTHSDTEVLLYHFLAHGPEGLSRLNGMFAFAVWDREEQSLFLARDRFGKKPLYYYDNGDAFIFSSEPKGILKYLPTRPHLNRTALAQYFFYEYIPSPRSPWNDIWKLAPGHWMRVTANEVAVQQWWTLHPTPHEYTGSMANPTRKFDRLLNDAVRARLVADVPVGVLLSGGIDSSAITWYMRQHVEELHSFSVGFEESSFNESSYAHKVADSLGTIHHEGLFTPPRAQEMLDLILPRLDEPLADASLLPTTYVSQLAKQHVTVVLDGDGADELLYGYDTFAADDIARVLESLPRLIQQLLIRAANLLPTKYTNFSLDFKLKMLVRGLPFLGATRNQVWIGSFHPGELQQLLTTPWQEFAGTVTEPIVALETILRALTARERLSLIYLQQYLHNDILVKLDRASMYCSLEARTPFLDPTLVSFILQLPLHKKYAWGHGKLLLKRVLRGRLPAEIIARPKKGFGIPLGAWLRGPLRPLMEETLSSEALRQAGVVDPAVVRALVAEHLSGRADHRKKLWTLMVFHWWWERWAV